MKGLRSFLWTVIFLLLLLYAVGVFITQSVTDFKISLCARTLCRYCNAKITKGGKEGEVI